MTLLLAASSLAASPDEVLMNRARISFEAGKFDDALKQYSQVSKDSDFWLQSLEEKAWTYLRQGKFEKAISQYLTLTTPAFEPQVGPETYLIGSFSALKICDYKTVFDVIKDFKNKYKDISGELERLSQTGTSSAVDRAVSKLNEDSELNWADLGKDVEKLPQFLNRDRALLKAIENNQKSQITARVKQLAARDVKELSKIVQKLHIIEVEAIQRMNLSQKAVAFNKEQHPRDSDTIEFPKENEIWLDEIEHYQVNAKGCSAREKGAKL